jgi:hypothetical protein
VFSSSFFLLKNRTFLFNESAADFFFFFRTCVYASNARLPAFPTRSVFSSFAFPVVVDVAQYLPQESSPPLRCVFLCTTFFFLNVRE